MIQWEKIFFLILSLLFLSSFNPLNGQPREIAAISESRTRVSLADEMVMVFIPGGEFNMGSEHQNSLAEKDEKPVHAVSLDAFWMDKTEVSNQIFVRYLNAEKIDKNAAGWILDSSQSDIYYVEVLNLILAVKDVILIFKHSQQPVQPTTKLSVRPFI